jgi:hypothetical protein
MNISIGAPEGAPYMPLIPAMWRIPERLTMRPETCIVSIILKGEEHDVRNVRKEAQEERREEEGQEGREEEDRQEKKVTLPPAG